MYAISKLAYKEAYCNDVTAVFLVASCPVNNVALQHFTESLKAPPYYSLWFRENTENHQAVTAERRQHTV